MGLGWLGIYIYRCILIIYIYVYYIDKIRLVRTRLDRLIVDALWSIMINLRRISMRSQALYCSRESNLQRLGFIGELDNPDMAPRNIWPESYGHLWRYCFLLFVSQSSVVTNAIWHSCEAILSDYFVLASRLGLRWSVGYTKASNEAEIGRRCWLTSYEGFPWRHGLGCPACFLPPTISCAAGAFSSEHLWRIYV